MFITYYYTFYNHCHVINRSHVISVLFPLTALFASIIKQQNISLLKFGKIFEFKKKLREINLFVTFNP